MKKTESTFRPNFKEDRNKMGNQLLKEITHLRK